MLTPAPDKNRKNLISFNCTEISGFESLRTQQGMKELLLVEHQEKDDFIKHAAGMILKFIFQSLPYHRSERTLLDNLLQQGYSYQEISLALALAWWDGEGKFYLPQRKKFEWLIGDGTMAILSILLALGTVVSIIVVSRKSNPNAVAYVLWLEPLLAFGSLSCAVVYFWLLRRLVAFFK